MIFLHFHSKLQGTRSSPAGIANSDIILSSSVNVNDLPTQKFLDGRILFPIASVVRPFDASPVSLFLSREILLSIDLLEIYQVANE